MSTLFKTIRTRGLLFIGATIFNRVVPEWLFRMRYYTVFRLRTDVEKMPALGVNCGWCDREHENVAAEELTCYRRELSTGKVRATRATIDGALVGAFWCAEKMFDENELGVRVMLAGRQTWLFAAAVDKAYRGRRIFPQLLQFTTHALAKEGIGTQLASVNPVNKSSMAVFSKYSHDQPARVFAIRFLSLAACLTFGEATRDRSFSFNCRRNPIRVQLLTNRS